MPLVYKIDVLQALKDKGYNTNRLRKEKILAESTIQKLRENKPISWANIAQICDLLNCQPNYFLENVEGTAPCPSHTIASREIVCQFPGSTCPPSGW